MMLSDSFVGVEDDSSPAGAPVDKIEITPEMIERGLIEFFDYDPEANEAEEIVEKIFLSMLSVSKEKNRHSL